MTTSFIPGSTWELTINANCIPAGRYTLVEESGEFLIFQVGKRIQFGLTTAFYRPFLKAIAGGDATAPTKTPEFIAKYKDLFERPQGLPKTIESMTFCVMHPSLEKHFPVMKPLLDTAMLSSLVH